MIKAALFDMDGLLVDTETRGIDVAINVCKKLGFELTEGEKQSFIGVTDEKFYQELLEKRRLELNVKEILHRHFEEYDNVLREGVGAFPGATSLPLLLKQNEMLLALVSGSTREEINIVLQQLQIKNCFDVIVSADDITKSKPDPQGYARAMKKLRVEPHECVVLEDATTGVKAGKGAGAKVIGVVNNGGQDLVLADRTVKNLTAVTMELIRNLG